MIKAKKGKKHPDDKIILCIASKSVFEAKFAS